jgi:hypothetical protein
MARFHSATRIPAPRVFRNGWPVAPGVAFLGERAILEANPWEEGTQCVTTPWHTFPTDWP